MIGCAAPRCSPDPERRLEGDIAHALFDQVLDETRRQELLSDEPFSVDGTLIEAWASQ